MSRVLLLAADSPLPLWDMKTPHTVAVTVEGETFSVTAPVGFAVAEHSYYRFAVDELGLSMKPCQYELSLESTPDHLAHLKDYLRRHLPEGGEAELWNLWVGCDREKKVPHYRGSLSDFDGDTLEQLLHPPHSRGRVGQCCITVFT